MERVGSGRESGRAARAPTRWRGRQAAPQLVTFHFSLVTAAAGRGGAPAARAGKRLARRARPTRRGGEWKGRGAAGSRTSGSHAMLVQKVRRHFRGCGILPRRDGNGAAEGRTATFHLSLFTCHCGRRPRRCARCAGGKTARSESSPHHGAGGEWMGMGAAGSRTSGSGAGVVQQVMRCFRGCGILPRRGWGWRGRRPHRNLSLVTAAAGRRYQTAGLENEPLASVRRSGNWDAARAEGRMCL